MAVLRTNHNPNHIRSVLALYRGIDGCQYFVEHACLSYPLSSQFPHLLLEFVQNVEVGLVLFGILLQFNHTLVWIFLRRMEKWNHTHTSIKQPTPIYFLPQLGIFFLNTFFTILLFSLPYMRRREPQFFTWGCNIWRIFWEASCLPTLLFLPLQRTQTEILA